MMKKKSLKNIAGITLVEMLIALVITSLMMIAMLTSYNLINNSFSKVTNRAKISQDSRDIIGMLMRDIRMAGYKYFGDDIGYHSSHMPIRIQRSGNLCCDTIYIVYGDYDVNALKKTPPDSALPKKLNEVNTLLLSRKKKYIKHHQTP